MTIFSERYIIETGKVCVIDEINEKLNIINAFNFIKKDYDIKENVIFFKNNNFTINTIRELMKAITFFEKNECILDAKTAKERTDSFFSYYSYINDAIQNGKYSVTFEVYEDSKLLKYFFESKGYDVDFFSDRDAFNPTLFIRLHWNTNE